MPKLNKLGIAAENPTLRIIILLAIAAAMFVILWFIFRGIFSGVLQ